MDSGGFRQQPGRLDKLDVRLLHLIQRDVQGPVEVNTAAGVLNEANVETLFSSIKGRIEHTEVSGQAGQVEFSETSIPEVPGKTG